MKPERDAFERATGWLEHTDDLSLEEIRDVRRMLGHNVERSEQDFLTFFDSLASVGSEGAK